MLKRQVDWYIISHFIFNEIVSTLIVNTGGTSRIGAYNVMDVQLQYM